jgi:hypothetical protein
LLRELVDLDSPSGESTFCTVMVPERVSGPSFVPVLFAPGIGTSVWPISTVNSTAVTSISLIPSRKTSPKRPEIR